MSSLILTTTKNRTIRDTDYLSLRLFLWLFTTPNKSHFFVYDFAPAVVSSLPILLLSFVYLLAPMCLCLFFVIFCLCFFILLLCVSSSTLVGHKVFVLRVSDSLVGSFPLPPFHHDGGYYGCKISLKLLQSVTVGFRTFRNWEQLTIMGVKHRKNCKFSPME